MSIKDQIINRAFREINGLKANSHSFESFPNLPQNPKQFVKTTRGLQKIIKNLEKPQEMLTFE